MKTINLPPHPSAWPVLLRAMKEAEANRAKKARSKKKGTEAERALKELLDALEHAPGGLKLSTLRKDCFNLFADARQALGTAEFKRLKLDPRKIAMSDGTIINVPPGVSINPAAIAPHARVMVNVAECGKCGYQTNIVGDMTTHRKEKHPLKKWR